MKKFILSTILFSCGFLQVFADNLNSKYYVEIGVGNLISHDVMVGSNVNLGLMLIDRIGIESGLIYLTGEKDEYVIAMPVAMMITTLRQNAIYFFVKAGMQIALFHIDESKTVTLPLTGVGFGWSYKDLDISVQFQGLVWGLYSFSATYHF